jgi:hypothetical protein
MCQYHHCILSYLWWRISQPERFIKTFSHIKINYLTYFKDHVERKVPKYKNHKLRERKVKTLTRNWRDHWRTGTHKHTETVSRYFDRHGRLFQSEESKCFWTHDKDGVTRLYRDISTGTAVFLNRKTVNVSEHTTKMVTASL